MEPNANPWLCICYTSCIYRLPVNVGLLCWLLITLHLLTTSKPLLAYKHVNKHWNSMVSLVIQWMLIFPTVLLFSLANLLDCVGEAEVQTDFRGNNIVLFNTKKLHIWKCWGRHFFLDAPCRDLLTSSCDEVYVRLGTGSVLLAVKLYSHHTNIQTLCKCNTCWCEREFITCSNCYRLRVCLYYQNKTKGGL